MFGAEKKKKDESKRREPDAAASAAAPGKLEVENLFLDEKFSEFLSGLYDKMFKEDKVEIGGQHFTFTNYFPVEKIQ